jgi:hypothetical protein
MVTFGPTASVETIGKMIAEALAQLSAEEKLKIRAELLEKAARTLGRLA